MIGRPEQRGGLFTSIRNNMDEGSELLAKTLMALSAINNRLVEDASTEKYLHERREEDLKRAMDELNKYKSESFKSTATIRERDDVIKKLHTEIEGLKQKLLLKDKRRKKK